MLLRVVILVAAIAVSLASFGPGPDVPEPDGCADGDTDGVDGLELGAPDESAFMPWEDGDAIPLVTGDQGLDMLALRVRLTGPDVPACVRFEFMADYPDPELPESDARDSTGRSWSLATYEDDGGRTIKTHFLVLPTRPLPATDIHVLVRVGGVQVERDLWVEFGPDQQPDAGIPDAAAADADLSDADPGDAGGDDGGG